MNRQQILDKIAEFEAVLAAGERAVAHIVQWAWSHLHASGHIGSVVTGDIRTRIANLHTNAKNRMVAAETQEAPKASTPPPSTASLPEPYQVVASPDPNDKPA